MPLTLAEFKGVALRLRSNYCDFSYNHVTCVQFFTYQVKEATEILLNLLKDYLLQPFFLVGASNFGPAAAAPAGPALTALQYMTSHGCLDN